ncbi:MAG: UDP-N-acetylmuramoylalanyl-D-glutamyl-2,6-diaminopimelate--D-alanyl-D-alanine ligase [Alphaproteobacteria bacterium]|nr:UDP-N-acetylmuramoylalanyl-D-glutamyl-2,6-diaminopimelate--D-alanyl-D-alanine ligase [Alphaproteobacteria bacterium]
MTAPAALWTTEETCAATGGRPAGGPDSWEATGVSIDSRTCAQGDLFVAISGERFDGHDFVAGAFEAGASAAVVSRIPDDVPEGAALVQVENPMAALEALGLAARDRTDARIVAVTGSVGKTGTKEALTLAFGALGPTHATQGNLNNHIGVPLTLARMPKASAYAVIEMGMNHAGEISALSRMARPHVGIITTIAAVHLEFFDSVAGIADAKAEIFDGMSRGGTAVLNRDNIYFAILAARAWSHGLEQVRGFGAHPDADARLAASLMTDAGSDVTAAIGDRIVRYRLNVPGRHWVHNTLAVLASVQALDGDLDLAAAALEKLSAPQGRGARFEIPGEHGTLTVIDDSYNASPTSMRAAIAVLSAASPARGGRRIAVLGDMLELGDTAPQLHASLAPDLEAGDIDLVFCAGPNMAALDDALPAQLRGGHADTSEELADTVVDAVRDGDVLLVKGSLGSRMALVVDALKALGDGESDEVSHAV